MPPSRAVRQDGSQPIAKQVDDFIEAAELDPARLAERLASDDQGLPLSVELNTPGWVNRLSTSAIPGELVGYVRHYEQARLGADFKRWLTQNETRFADHATAIQQWDSYQAAYEQARGHVPLHVLPHFQAGNEWARQTFALGSLLLGFINNQGAYFYYIPADPLARPVKLAQGLANSLNAFTGKDGLVQEVRERVEQVVAKQGVEATLRALSRYYEATNPNGRYPTDDLVLELKRLVRAYADELRQIHQFAPLSWTTGDSGGETRPGPMSEGD
ncbi:MAG: hypothetical protein ACE5G8_07000 [Anaerolineae bacterium]